MVLELKYLKELEEIRAKEASILMTVQKQQRDFRHEICDWLNTLDELVTVDSDNDTITQWMCANSDQLFASNNQFLKPATAANQVEYTVITRHTTGLGNGVGFDASVGSDVGSSADVGSGVGSGAGLGSGVDVSTGVGSGVGSIAGVSLGVGVGVGVGSAAGVTFSADNDVDSGGGNGLGSGGGNGISSGGGNGKGFGGVNGMDFGIEIGASGDLGEGLVCLGIQPTETATGLASSGVYIMAHISPVASRGHSTPASLVSRAVKPPHLLLYAKAVSVLAVVRPFKNTQDAIMYNKFLEVANNNEK